MEEFCKYLLPCGRCDKFNISCDLSYADMKFISEMSKMSKDKCEHEWIHKRILEGQETI